MAAKTTPGLNSDRRFQLFAPGFLTWNALLTTVLSIGVNSYWAHGLKPTHFYDHGARLYDEPPPHFCDVIFSKLCFNCTHWFYTMPTNRQTIHSLKWIEKGLNLPAPSDIQWPKCFQLQGGLCPPDQGLCPWAPLEALPPDHRYRLVLRTRHGAPIQVD